MAVARMTDGCPSARALNSSSPTAVKRRGQSCREPQPTKEPIQESSHHCDVLTGNHQDVIDASYAKSFLNSGIQRRPVTQQQRLHDARCLSDANVLSSRDSNALRRCWIWRESQLP